MKSKPLFQFSLIGNKHRLNELRAGIKQLGADYDESKVSLFNYFLIDKCQF